MFSEFPPYYPYSSIFFNGSLTSSLMHGSFSESLLNGYIIVREALPSQNPIASHPSNFNPQLSKKRRLVNNPANSHQRMSSCSPPLVSPFNTEASISPLPPLKKQKINVQETNQTQIKKIIVATQKKARKRYENRKKKLDDLREGHNTLNALTSTVKQLARNHIVDFPDTRLRTLKFPEATDKTEKIEKIFSIIAKEVSEFKKNSDFKRKNLREEIHVLENENIKIKKEIAKFEI
jgi:hypothetical protein